MHRVLIQERFVMNWFVIRQQNGLEIEQAFCYNDLTDQRSLINF
jgi:hypothetical protein